MTHSSTQVVKPRWTSPTDSNTSHFANTCIALFCTDISKYHVHRSANIYIYIGTSVDMIFRYVCTLVIYIYIYITSVSLMLMCWAAILDSEIRRCWICFFFHFWVNYSFNNKMISPFSFNIPEQIGQFKWVGSVLFCVPLLWEGIPYWPRDKLSQTSPCLQCKQHWLNVVQTGQHGHITG